MEENNHNFLFLFFRPRRISLWLTIFYFLFSVNEVHAASASLYLSPSSGSFLVGSVFTVSVFLNTEGNEINTVQADLKFSSDILQVTSPTIGTSFIAQWLNPPNYSNERGVISFSGGVPGGIKTSAGLISSITFRAISSGIAKIQIAKDSQVLLNDGRGTDILTNTVDGEYQILIPPPEGPQVFSPTHPSPNVWYPDSSPSFSWDRDGGATDFSWSFYQNMTTRPDGISEGADTQASFSGVKDGTWYFHLRQKKEGVWGKTSTVQVFTDITPPKEFTPKVQTYNRLVGYQTMVYFETTDDSSGIDHYEVSVIDLSEKESTRSFFTEEISPYQVPFKKAGKYNVIIKAVDKAGNAREEEAIFRMITPLISHIQGKGLEIRGTLFSWGTIWFLILLCLGGTGGAAWWFLVKRKK